jgi:hypothetical protein
MSGVIVLNKVKAIQDGTWNIGTLASITNPVAVTGTFWQATQPVSIAASVTVAQATGTNLHAVLDSGTLTGITNPVAVTGTFWQATQPISAVSLPLPTGAATEATLSAMSAKLPVALDGSGYLKVHEQGTANVSITNSTATLKTAAAAVSGDTAVVVTLHPDTASMPVSGTLSSSQLPASLDGSGYLKVHEQGTANVNITNSTATLKTSAAAVAGDTAVTVTIHPSTATMPVSGTVAVSNLAGSKTAADAFANPTDAVSELSFLMGYNGATWDRVHATSGSLNVHLDAQTVAISAASLPLPTGAATESTLSAMSAKLPAALDGSGYLKVHEQGTANVNVTNSTATLKTNAAAVAGDTAVAVTIHPSTASMPVTGTFWQATQPISGTVAVTGTFWQATQPVSIAATVSVQGGKTNNNAAPGATNVGTLPALANAAAPSWTEGNQVALSVDLAGALRTAISSVSQLPAALDGSGYLKVHEQGTANVSVTNASATLKTSAAAVSGDTAVAVTIHPSTATLPVSGTFWQATQPVSIAASVTVAQATGTNLHMVVDSGTLTGITNPVAVTGTFWQATQPISAASLPLPSGAATEATLSTLNGKVPSNLTVSSTRLLVDGSGVTQPVSGTVAISNVVHVDDNSSSLTVDGTVATNARAETANGGTSLSRTVAAASNNATNVKASAGQVYSIVCMNVAAYAVWVKLYNKASAPTPGSDTSVWVMGVPAGGGFVFQPPVPLTFGTGISFAIVKNPAESDNTSIAANDCVLSIQYA